MTLDETIKHCEDVAAKCFVERSARNHSGKCGFEHLELAAWLRELKAYKEQEPCEDAISRKELLKNQTVIVDDDGLAHKVVHIGRICAAPSVNPRLRTGKWIKHDTGHSIYYDCSLCGCTAPHIEVADKILWKLSNYCPDCGAEMEGIE